MKLILNIFLYFFIALMIVQNNLIVAGILVLWFTMRCGAVWLLPLAFMIDGYFGAFEHIPVITFYACAWYALSSFVRPRLLVHYKPYEKATR